MTSPRKSGDAKFQPGMPVVLVSAHKSDRKIREQFGRCEALQAYGSCRTCRTRCLVRSEGLEPPRCYSLPPQGSASTNSATSAKIADNGLAPGRIDGADVTNRG